MSRRKEKKQAPKQQAVRTVVGVEDMILLPDTKDSGIAANLRTRLNSELIYTSIGHVLVVCNPYKWLPIYSDEVMARYTLQQRVDVPPHIFATAEAAYRGMIQEEDNQCVIISGESGAGKTEASKQIQAYIAKVSGGGPQVENTKKVFLESNPVLEAFGNAKTLRNNNSSRFGKYFELKFDRYGAPIGGLVTNYLLEKSRIVKPGRGERNFHIFYQLLRSNAAEALGLALPASSFNYLNGGTGGGNSSVNAGGSGRVGGDHTVDGVDDQKEMEVTLAAMRSVGLKTGQIRSILSLVAAVLHLGNVEFEKKQVESVEGSRVVTKSGTSSAVALQRCCDLLGLDPKALCQCLTYRELQTMAPGGKVDTYQIPQNVAQATARRDAIAKAVYEQLFDLIVTRINVALDPAEGAAGAAGGGGGQGGGDLDLEVDVLSIGVLDIYGFEVFERNGFEQLCINYVNEKLQQIFIELTLNAEQLEYEAEGIAWQPIPFFNNKVVCELLDGARPSGLFRVLDDTCKTMHGTQAGLEVDKKFLDSARQLHGNNAHFRPLPTAFLVKHYAGEVTYDCGKLGESNKDALDQDLLALIKSSSDKLLSHLFRDSEVGQPGGGGSGGPAVPSAGTRIRQQCQLLVTSLMQCSPHYVRCVKSNDEKKALSMDLARVQHQVQYLGLAENIKVRRAGFAYRNDFHRFLDRFAILSPATYPEWRGSDINGCKEILKSIHQMALPGGLSLKSEVQLGRSKIFIRTPEMYFAIEQLRERQFERFAEKIQRAYRRYRNSRELVALQNLMHGLYSEHQKTRRRESIYRPFSGDSLNQLDASFLDTSVSTGKHHGGLSAAAHEALVERFRDSMYRIIDHYSAAETVLFVDPHAAQVVRSAPQQHATHGSAHTSTGNSAAVGCGPGFCTLPRVLVLTTAALYVMEVLTPEMWRARQLAAGVAPADCAAKPPPGILTLRRRVPLPHGPGNGKPSKRVSHDGTDFGVVTGLMMSRLADCLMLLQVTPQNIMPLAHSQAMHNTKAMWAKNDSSAVCAVTGLPFTLYHRRHHCRVTGALVRGEASMHTQLLPDKQLHTPQRISDPVIGLISTDPFEDLLLLSERKTEFAALLASQILNLKTGDNVQLSVPSLGSIVTFSNVLKPRPNTLVPAHISLIPAAEVRVHEVAPPPVKKGNNADMNLPPALRTLAHCAIASEGGGRLTVTCAAAGISHQAVLERRQRQLERQRRAEKRRRREARERHERHAAREAEREQVRLQRLAERRAKKRAEREDRRRRAEAAAGVAPKLARSGSSLKAAGSGSAPLGSAIAGAAPPVVRVGKTKTPGLSDRDGNGPPSSVGVAAVEPAPRSRVPVHGVPMMGNQPSGANSELMAAMARRRAKE